MLLKFIVTAAPAGTDIVLTLNDKLWATISRVILLPEAVTVGVLVEAGLEVAVGAGGTVMDIVGEAVVSVGWATVVAGVLGVGLGTVVVVVGGVVTAAVLGEVVGVDVDEQAAAANKAAAANNTTNVLNKLVCRILSPLLILFLSNSTQVQY